ncbi:MAG: 2-C-methyl-D-erythritol 4-phosphate cytidylyltransferase [Steroidobacteraceae bacterium]|nr:2-C-methyl-D-erythritol 4-phosphate cytidylyltransferase [Steroidobacteraceae bacterium]
MSRPARRWAVVVAAGRGERFGGSTPKQYTLLLGRPALSWSLAALLASPAVDGVVVALAPRDRRWKRLAESRSPRISTCVGGDRREASVSNALLSLAARAHDDDWVIVHDAARPCLRREDLDKLIAATRRDPVGGLLAIPVPDTLKVNDGRGRSARTADRSVLWRALTPQIFRYGLLRRALALCVERERVVTDEASAVEALGLRPRLVQGRGDNIKLTTPADRVLAEAILRAGRRT